MKTKLLLLTLFISAVTFAQYTAIPDPNFENALSAYDDIPNDGQVPTANISGITSLDVNNDPAEGGSLLFEITDLTGIQDFTALQTLNCSYNQLTILDLSQNTALQTLDCSFNQLTALNVSQNTALQYLDCIDNQLTALDVSQNTALQELYCVANQLTALDVSQNTNLLTLVCGGNNLISLDVSQNTVLQMLWCSYTPLLTALDVSQNTDLQNLYCYNSQLSSLNVKNGNNTNFTYFDATNNPNLTCIEVDDPAWSTTNWTNIDPQTSFSLNCDNAETYVPDDNFENYLETHDANGNTVAIGDPNNMGNGIANDDYVTTTNISGVTNLDISNQSVSDLTGLQDFISLEIFTATFNPIGTIDLSSNTSLTDFNCFDCQLTSIDVSQNVNLERLYVDNNQLTTLDVTNNSLLIELYVTNNQLTNIDVSQNPNLTFFNCNNNQITSLDVSSNTALISLNCQNNQLTSMNMRNGNNTVMTTFNAINNPDLTCIFVDDAAYSTANWTNIDPTATFVETQAECNALAVTDLSFENNLSIYPNPTRNQVNIQIDRNADYKIYNINGQLLIKGNVSQGNNTLDIKKLSQGVYFIRLTDKKTEINRKLIIK